MSFIQISTSILNYLRFHFKESAELQCKITADFEKFDENKAGILSQTVIHKFIQEKVFEGSKNIYQYELNEEKTEQLLKECDSANNGNYSKAEFKDLWVYLHIRSGEVLNKKIKANKGMFIGKFKNYDLNESGFIENENVEVLLDQFNESIKADEFKVKGVAEFLEAYDLDKDGKLSFDEFLEIMFDLNMLRFANRF